MFRSQFQSFLVTSETNQGYFFPWNLTSLAKPLWIKKSATCYSVSNQYENLIVPVNILTVDEVTVELETCVIEDKVDSSSTLSLESFHGLPQFWKAVVEDVLFGSCELFTTGSLQRLDLLLGHVDEQ